MITVSAERFHDEEGLSDEKSDIHYLTTFKPDFVQERLGKVDTKFREAFIDVADQIMQHPEQFALKERDKSGQPPEPGTRISFEAADYDGGTVTCADLTAGSKVTVITFWQTFCEPCKKEMPDLDRLAREGSGRLHRRFR